MKNTKQTYVEPALKSLEIGVRSIMCMSPEAETEAVTYRNLGSCDD